MTHTANLRSAAPATREEVCELLREASAQRHIVMPVGSGTKLGMGGAGAPVDMTVSLAKLSRVVDYPASDLTITVEAGLPVRELAAMLAAKGQMLPLDVPFAENATIGGTIATNINGPRRLGYGSWRDIVLGMQFVTAEGKLAKGGGKVVKNVAGYDIPKLLIGSVGTLGVIAEITFKVFPIPPAAATLVMRFDSSQNAARAASRMVHSQLLPQALDLVDAAGGVLSGQPALSAAPFTLIAGIAGPEQVLARFGRELPALVRSDQLRDYAILRGEQESALWGALQELTPAFVGAAPSCLVKASLPLSKMGEYLARSQHPADDGAISPATLARAGSGIVYTRLWPARTSNRLSGALERIGSAAEALVASAERLGGRGIVEWCPAELRSKINLWGTPGDDLPWMRKLKAAMDPQGILNPGRFYGGI